MYSRIKHYLAMYGVLYSVVQCTPDEWMGPKAGGGGHLYSEVDIMLEYGPKNRP